MSTTFDNGPAAPIGTFSSLSFFDVAPLPITVSGESHDNGPAAPLGEEQAAIGFDDGPAAPLGDFDTLTFDNGAALPIGTFDALAFDDGPAGPATVTSGGSFDIGPAAPIGAEIGVFDNGPAAPIDPTAPPVVIESAGFVDENLIPFIDPETGEQFQDPGT